MPPDDSLRRIETLERKAARLEQELSALRLSGQRVTVQQSLMDERLLLLERNRLFRLWDKVYRSAARFYGRLGLSKRYGGLSDLRTPDDYARWVSHERHEMDAEDHEGSAAQWTLRPLISVLIPESRDALEAGYRDSVRSVFEQCYADWELCLAFEGEPPASVVEEIKRGGEQAARTRIVKTSDTGNGDFVFILRAGDRLSPHALHYYVQALQSEEHSAPALLYSDEDSIGGDGNRTDPLFKPGWSPDLLLSTMYLGSAILYRRDVFLAHEGYPLQSASAARWDLALRIAETIAEKHSRVCHIPRVLYHRVPRRDSAKQCNPEAAGQERDAIEAALRRRGIAGTIESAAAPGCYRLRYTAPPEARLSIIVCSRHIERVRECLKAVRETVAVPCEILLVHHLESGSGEEMRRCVESFSGTTIPYGGAFDFARMNNLAAAGATAPYLLFLNDDVVTLERGWGESITATLGRPEIGIAGAILRYPNGAVQHAGVVSGIGDAAGHCGRFQMSSELWPWLLLSRDVAAVTGAMLGIRRELFERIGGFDELFPFNYNDVDLCFRAREAGLRVVCLDVGRVIHRESQTRTGGTRHDERDALYSRWAGVLAAPDEFYSPNLAPTERIALNTEAGGRSRFKELTALGVARR